MLAEHGSAIGVQEIERGAQPLTWHESLYGKVPTAEHFRTAEAAFDKFEASHNEFSEELLAVGKLEDEPAQEYANRAARLAVGMREFCRSCGIDPDIATLDVLIGRNEKYIKAWPDAMKLVLESGQEPNVANIKDACRTLWGKWQLTLEPHEHEVLAEARRLYEIALSEGHSDERARVLVGEILALDNKTTIKKYVTQKGHPRTLDLMEYIDLRPDLEGVVASSKGFEETCEQSIEDSVRQLKSEMAEVKELRGFFYVQGGETVDTPATMVFKSESIEDFRRHFSMVDDPLTYIQEHLAYECIDVMVAAAGILHRIPADVALAEIDARVDRERYADALLHARDELQARGIPLTPAHLRRILETAELGLPDGDYENTIPLAVALLGNGIRFKSDPQLSLQ